MSDDPRAPAPSPAGESAGGEQRALTPDEMKQIDVMLGHAGPTLIRPKTEPARAASAGLLQTVIVAIILLSIVAGALYLFR